MWVTVCGDQHVGFRLPYVVTVCDVHHVGFWLPYVMLQYVTFRVRPQVDFRFSHVAKIPYM